jgi:hypothetical protein
MPLGLVDDGPRAQRLGELVGAGGGGEVQPGVVEHDGGVRRQVLPSLTRLSSKAFGVRE